MFSKETLQIVKRLQKARLSLMQKQPFYTVLLLHMQFSLDPMCETAYTDGVRIAFCPEFINALSDPELEFVLMHEVLHAALNHCGRTLQTYDFDDFNVACDIVVNSNILYSCGMDKSAITLRGYGESMHLAPDGTEGYLYTAEEVYGQIQAVKTFEKKSGKAQESGSGSGNGSDKGSGDGKNGENETPPARPDGGFDDHTYWGPDGDGDGDGGDGDGNSEMRDAWLQRMIEATDITARIEERKGGKGCGPTPLGAQRIVSELKNPQTDWRTVLDTFIQEEITDYSFNPPDRRFQDSPFLLPDYNEKDESVKDILFMIDTSGSMSDGMITQAYSEIYGAIAQFNGRLQGRLGFFDAKVVEPKKFSDEEDFKIIRPMGGGGTNFHCIFDYVREHIDEISPVSIVILTDGYAPFPDESAAMDIPVLWIINNEEITPPWGKVTRIKVEN